MREAKPKKESYASLVEHPLALFVNSAPVASPRPCDVLHHRRAADITAFQTLQSANGALAFVYEAFQRK
jgi:hypothetical protein